MKTIYLAGGCFWGTQHFFEQIKGIINTTVGYANSLKENPSYNEVKQNNTDAAECVKIEYDNAIISLSEILKLYFMTIDPESIDKQGEDKGHQYRTGIYYINEDDIQTINTEINILKNTHKIINIEIKKLINFYDAEEYHQNYLVKNPNGYCHISRELIDFAKKYKQ